MLICSRKTVSQTVPALFCFSLLQNMLPLRCSLPPLNLALSTTLNLWKQIHYKHLLKLPRGCFCAEKLVCYRNSSLDEYCEHLHTVQWNLFLPSESFSFSLQTLPHHHLFPPLYLQVLLLLLLHHTGQALKKHFTYSYFLLMQTLPTVNIHRAKQQKQEGTSPLMA